MTNPAPSHLLNLPNELLFIIAEHLPSPTSTPSYKPTAISPQCSPLSCTNLP